ncbi:MAG TPA: GNAT family N-acetyltransferase [Fluviicola sp.]|nr:GNAT family N-acetyltransferase [Fluviicola sp.]
MMITLQPTTDHRLIARLNEEVQQLHVNLHPEVFKPYDPTAVESALESMMAKPNSHAFVAMLGEIPAGFMLMFVKRIPENAFIYARETLYIDQIGVLNEYRKTGVGKLLMEQAEKLAQELGIKRIELDHWTANSVAAKYFRSKGYALYREQLFKEM